MGTGWLVLETTDVLQTQACGARLARLLRPGDVIALSGDLGSGKTAFTQGLATALGVQAAVTSPTFVLINRYACPAGCFLQHVDCYRLSNALVEMWDVGLSDLFDGDDIVVIEWADRVVELLPEEYLEVAFEYLDITCRRLCFRPHGSRYRRMVERLRAAPKGS